MPELQWFKNEFSECNDWDLEDHGEILRNENLVKRKRKKKREGGKCLIFILNIKEIIYINERWNDRIYD